MKQDEKIATELCTELKIQLAGTGDTARKERRSLKQQRHEVNLAVSRRAVLLKI